MRYEEFVKQTVKELTGIGYLKLSDFPGIDLYMDQVTTFMDKKLSMYKKNDKELILTKTMINNYTKHNVMPKPIGKKYTKDHMIFLTLIYHLKGVLQINDIEKLLNPLMENYTDDFEDKIDLSDLYRAILKSQESELTYLNETLDQDIERIKENLNSVEFEEDDMLEMFVLITTLAVRANAQKYLAEKLLKQYFVEAPVPKIKTKEIKVKQKLKNKAPEAEKAEKGE